MSETQFLIMCGLIAPAHGYAIMQTIEQLTMGAVSVGPGTMYGTLKKLLRKGLIIEVAHDEAQERRILYTLTTEGRELLEREIDRLQTLSAIGEQKRSELRKKHG